MYEEEIANLNDGKQISQQGNYLCVQYWNHPRHVYKLVSPGQNLHPHTSRVEHAGKLYGLAWIEEDKE